MAYVLDLQPGERLLTDIDFQPSRKTESFRFAVSDQAVYVPATRFVVAGDPRYFQRIPVEQVDMVRVETVTPYGFDAAAVLMVAAGLTVLWSTQLPGAGITPRGLGWSLAVLAGGALLPIAGRGRSRLLIRWSGRTFRWSPPLIVDSPSKRQLNEVLDRILQACASAHIRTVDDRGGNRVG